MLSFGMPTSAQDLPGVSAVTASKPSFAPGESITITVVATDDNGELQIWSNLSGTTLSVTGCTVNGDNAVANTCTGTRTAVNGQGTRDIFVDTESIDADDEPDADLRVTLTLKNVPTCSEGTAVTVEADQPANAGPDLVTINCIPNTPTPTPTNTPSPTATPTTPPSTATPTSVPPTATPTVITQVLSSGIQPPNTGDAGLK
jgi:hypothetical protein